MLREAHHRTVGGAVHRTGRSRVAGRAFGHGSDRGNPVGKPRQRPGTAGRRATAKDSGCTAASLQSQPPPGGTTPRRAARSGPRRPALRGQRRTGLSGPTDAARQANRQRQGEGSAAAQVETVPGPMRRASRCAAPTGPNGLIASNGLAGRNARGARPASPRPARAPASSPWLCYGPSPEAPAGTPSEVRARARRPDGENGAGGDAGPVCVGEPRAPPLVDAPMDGRAAQFSDPVGSPRWWSSHG